MSYLKIVPYLFIFFPLMKAQANDICIDAFQFYKIGFTLSGSILESQQYHPSYAGNKSKQEIIDAITRRIRSKGHEPKAVSSIENLAKEIVLSAEAFGVDPFIFAGVIENETNYGAAIYNTTGGDSGYTQMTTAGLSELRSQFLHSRNGPILMTMARRYFQSMSPDAFYNWITSENYDQKREDLLTNPAYSLAAGAALLKIYLSVPVVVSPYNNYNYEPHGYAYALALYNANRTVFPGDEYPHYLLYSRKARRNARLARDASFGSCLATEESDRDNEFARSIIMGACDLGDDEAVCEQALEQEFVSDDASIEI